MGAQNCFINYDRQECLHTSIRSQYIYYTKNIKNHIKAHLPNSFSLLTSQFSMRQAYKGA